MAVGTRIDSKAVPAAQTQVYSSDGFKRVAATCDNTVENDKTEVHGNRTVGESQEKMTNSVSGGAESGALMAYSRELAEVLDAWSELPSAVRRGILAMVRAARD